MQRNSKKLFSFFGFVKLKIAQITIEKQICSTKDSKKKNNNKQKETKNNNNNNNNNNIKKQQEY